MSDKIIAEFTRELLAREYLANQRHQQYANMAGQDPATSVIDNRAMAKEIDRLRKIIALREEDTQRLDFLEEKKCSIGPGFPEGVGKLGFNVIPYCIRLVRSFNGANIREAIDKAMLEVR
jgi:hypothetical protein